MAIRTSDTIHDAFWDLTIGYEQGRAKKESHRGGSSYDLWLINSTACLIREVDRSGKETFYAIERLSSCIGGMDYWRSTKGSFKRAKKAFDEKYSPEWQRQLALARK